MTTCGFIGDQHFQPSPPRNRKDDFAQSLLKKFEWCLSEVDILITPGDFGERPSLPDHLKNLILEMVTRSGKQWIGIVGNHDIYFYNMESYIKTTVQNMEFANSIKILSHTPYMVEDIAFYGTTMGKRIAIPKNESGKRSILVGHCWFNSQTEPNLSIFPDEVIDLGHTLYLLGHDHEPHDPVVVKEAMVIRPGSFARGTAHEYNVKRIPNMVKFTINGDQIQDMRTVPIATALPPEEVFYEEVFTNKPVERMNMNFMDELKGILDMFKQRASTNGQTISSALAQLKAPDSVVSYLKMAYNRCGCKFD